MTVDRELRRKFRDTFNLLVILGPTASGKTGLAVRLARRLGGEILSADSRQVYRGMDLGTGKDLSEYGRDGEAVPFHLIDICEPEEEFSLFAFQQLFYRTFRQVSKRERVPLMVGGTGLYLDAILRGYRLAAVPEDPALRDRLAGEGMEALQRRFRELHPDAHNTTDLLEKNRLIRAIEIAEFVRDHPDEAAPPVHFAPLVIGIRCDREALRRRITARLKMRLEAGMVEEVERLHARGIGWERIDAFGLEYRSVALYLQRKISREEMFQTLNTRIHQFAKRQETWFRRMEKHGVPIRWIEGADEAAALGLITGAVE